MRSIDTQLRSATPTHILDNCRLCVIFDSCRLRHFDNAASFLTIAAGAREQEKPMRIKMFAYVGLVTIQVSISLMCAPAAAHRLPLPAHRRARARARVYSPAWRRHEQRVDLVPGDAVRLHVEPLRFVRQVAGQLQQTQ